MQLNNQEEGKRMSVDELARMPRAMRRHFAKKTGYKIRGINEMHINTKKNKKGLLDIAKRVK